MSWPVALWFGLWTAVIALGDYRTGRIRNTALAAFWIPGVVWLLVAGYLFPGHGWLLCLAGMALALLLLLPGYLLGMLGGGDVKYAAVVGFYSGPFVVLFMCAIGMPLWWGMQKLRGGGAGAMPMGPALTLGVWLGWPLCLLWLHQSW